jgi:hypothetical protein
MDLRFPLKHSNEYFGQQHELLTLKHSLSSIHVTCNAEDGFVPPQAKRHSSAEWFPDKRFLLCFLVPVVVQGTSKMQIIY